MDNDFTLENEIHEKIVVQKRENVILVFFFFFALCPSDNFVSGVFFSSAFGIGCSYLCTVIEVSVFLSLCIGSTVFHSIHFGVFDAGVQCKGERWKRQELLHWKIFHGLA